MVIMIRSAVIFAHFQPFMPLILHLEGRHSKRYWLARFLPPHIYDSLPVLILYAINDLLYSYMCFFVSVFVISIVQFYISVENIFLQRLKQKVTFFLLRRSHCHHFHIRQQFMEYRQLQILERVGNAGFSHTLVPAMLVIAMNCLILIITCLVRSNAVLNPVLKFNFVICTGFIIVGLQIVVDGGARINQTSKEILFLLLNRSALTTLLRKAVPLTRYQRKVDKMAVNSLQDLRIYFGNVLYFQEGTFINYAKLILDQTINLLLMTR